MAKEVNFLAPTLRATEKPSAVDVSIIVPIYNEEDSIGLLADRLFHVLDPLGTSFEIIAVNDGSQDASFVRLKEIAAQRSEFKIVNFRRNHGQTAALMAGIDHASGEIVVSIDADLQNDPEDIPILLDKLAEGYDLVSGWRQNRQDNPIRRNLVSRVANRVISRISGVRLHDYGCTLKAYRKDMLQGMRLYGEMHRLIPIYATWMGARVVEIPVRHHPRRFGTSKYGLERVIKVVLDLIVVTFLDRYFVKPMYVFGGFGIFSLVLSFLSGIWMLWLKWVEGFYMIQTPLPLFAAMTFLVGIMSILMGLLAEILVRTYFESQQRRSYLVRDLINFDNLD
jgi:dolichol-phosphate mannosyltransferase